MLQDVVKFCSLHGAMALRLPISDIVGFRLCADLGFIGPGARTLSLCPMEPIGPNGPIPFSILSSSTMSNGASEGIRTSWAPIISLMVMLMALICWVRSAISSLTDCNPVRFANSLVLIDLLRLLLPLVYSLFGADNARVSTFSDLIASRLSIRFCLIVSSLCIYEMN